MIVTCVQTLSSLRDELEDERHFAKIKQVPAYVHTYVCVICVCVYVHVYTYVRIYMIVMRTVYK